MTSTEATARQPLVMPLTDAAATSIRRVDEHLDAALDEALTLQDDESRLQVLSHLARSLPDTTIVLRHPDGTQDTRASFGARVQQARGAALQAARDRGMSYRAIGHVCGMGRAAVQQALRRYRGA